MTTVMVIDDDPSVRESIAAFLVEYEYQVIACADPDDAWFALKSRSVDAVICDLRMGGVTGIDWLEHIKQVYPRLPVIIVSGAGVMNDAVRALRLGADDFLVKPIPDLEVLHFALQRALQRSELESENTAYREYLEKTNFDLKRGLDELRADQMAGRQIQLSMLPEEQNICGVQCEHSIIPSLLLSGDFLDYFSLDEHRMVFYIADVSGHGASSAFVTVLLKNLTYRLRRNFKRGSSDDLLHPVKVLDRLNNELLATHLKKHLTMCYGLIDFQTQALTYSIGGHLPLPVLLTRDGVSYLNGKGMPVGLFPEPVYREYTLTLPEDFALVMFSDGILEILNEPSMAAKEQALLDLVKQSKGVKSDLFTLLELDHHDDAPDDIAVMSLVRGEIE
ncbi:MAG: SpoIIE family protein phosphatase [Oceanobacter sp.]|jgi:serine phosphatase RsbU (regulator of sigma subunit)